jgi:hypothetical protein
MGEKMILHETLSMSNVSDPDAGSNMHTWRNFGAAHPDPESSMKYGIVCTWCECQNPIEVYRTKAEAMVALHRVVSETWDIYAPTIQSRYYKARAYFGWTTRQPGLSDTDTKVYIVDLDSLMPDGCNEVCV